MSTNMKAAVTDISDDTLLYVASTDFSGHPAGPFLGELEALDYVEERGLSNHTLLNVGHIDPEYHAERMQIVAEEWPAEKKQRAGLLPAATHRILEEAVANGDLTEYIDFGGSVIIRKPHQRRMILTSEHAQWAAFGYQLAQ